MQKVITFVVTIIILYRKKRYYVAMSIHTCTHIHTHTNTLTNMHTHTNIHTHTNTHTHAHKHTHIHKHTNTNTLLILSVTNSHNNGQHVSNN